MQIKALSANAVGGVLNVERDDDGYPRREGVAAVLRRLLEARGPLLEADLVQAAIELTAPHLAASPRLQGRIRSVLKVLVLAGEVAKPTGLGGSLCWGLPLRYVNIGGSRSAAVGTAALTSDAISLGRGIIRCVAARRDAPGLSVCLGTPSFRSSIALPGLSAEHHTSLLQFQAATIDAASRSDDTLEPSARPLEKDLTGGASLWESHDRVFLAVGGIGGTGAIALPDRETARWFSLATQLGDDLHSLRDGPLGLPAQILTALALFGEPDDDELSAWTLPEDLQQALRTWLGEPPKAAAFVESTATDRQQAAIIAAPPGARLIVEAGPGSGKTHVAIERVKSLIEADVSPTRIWMVSFTHAATGELRARIAATLGDLRSASELTISTLDSLAARLRRYGTTEGQVSRDYEASIADAVRLVETEDSQLTGFLRRLEHVIVDEIQDLSNQRSALLLAIVRHLHPSCGVTLFQDSAQAIYGFADIGSAPSKPVASQLQEAGLGFSVCELDQDHRTREQKLRDLKFRLRATLLDPNLTGDAKYANVRADIERSTPAARGAVEERLPLASSMVLFRSRLALVNATSRYWDRGRSFRLRLPWSEPVLAPWIGALLGACRVDEISRQDFEHMWEETWPTPVLLTPDRAWKVLKSFQGAGTGPALDTGGIAREMAAGTAPPPGATLPILGRTGALLSTVHAVKGLEAEHVVLVLPRVPGSTRGERLAEEARVLFVGATRPRATLEVAGDAELYASPPLPDGRRWVRRSDGHALVELGLQGDVDADGAGQDTEAAEARRSRLWAASERVVPVTAVRTDNTYELFAPNDESFGYLSPGVMADLRDIGHALHPGGARPARTIRGLHVAGVRTTYAYDPEGVPGARARFGLAPIVVGLPIVYFNASGLAETFTWETS